MIDALHTRLAEALRDALAAWLAGRGIGTGILYPSPVHRQPAYRNRVPVAPGGLREAETACDELLCLPVYPELGLSAATRVAEAVRAFYGSRATGRVG